MCNRKWGHTSRRSCSFPLSVLRARGLGGWMWPLLPIRSGAPQRPCFLAHFGNEKWHVKVQFSLREGKHKARAMIERSLSYNCLFVCSDTQTHINDKISGTVQLAKGRWLHSVNMVIHADSMETNTHIWWDKRTYIYIYTDSYSWICQHLSEVLRWAV